MSKNYLYNFIVIIVIVYFLQKFSELVLLVFLGNSGVCSSRASAADCCHTIK